MTRIRACPVGTCWNKNSIRLSTQQYLQSPMRLNPTQNGRKSCMSAIICYQMNGSIHPSLQIASLLLSLDSHQSNGFETTQLTRLLDTCFVNCAQSNPMTRFLRAVSTT